MRNYHPGDELVCQTKTYFPTLQAVLSHGRMKERKTGKAHNHYTCPCCGGFHLTSSNGKLGRAKKKKKKFRDHHTWVKKKHEYRRY